MASALETLCGQAYGAQQYKKFANQTYAAMLTLYVVCVFLSVIWIFMGRILIFLGQDPLISQEAGKFMIWLVPALFAYATLQALIRYFQTQSLIFPLLVSSCTTFCFHMVLCWALVFKSGLENLGAAMAISISYWFNAIFLCLYLCYSKKCAKTRFPISMELFQEIGVFVRLSIPSAVMIWYAMFI